jgi:hypothetical protein
MDTYEITLKVRARIYRNGPCVRLVLEQHDFSAARLLWVMDSEIMNMVRVPDRVVATSAELQAIIDGQPRDAPEALLRGIAQELLQRRLEETAKPK